MKKNLHFAGLGVVVACLLAVGCAAEGAADGLGSDVGSSVEPLLGSSGTVTTDGAEPDPGTPHITTVVEELPFAPPGSSTEWAGPSNWGLCGFIRISGDFAGAESQAKITTNSRGLYEVQVTRYTANAPVEAEWSCILLSQFEGLPSLEGAWHDYYSVTDTDDSGSGDFQNDATLQAMVEPEINAVTWAGFTGPLTGFYFSDSEPNLAEVGAYPVPSGACARDRFTDACPATPLMYEGNVVARTYTLNVLDGIEAQEMTSYAYEVGILEHAWNRQSELSFAELDHGDYLWAPTSDNWCILAGITGGGQFDEPGTRGPITVELYENTNPSSGLPDYRVRIDSFYQRQNTRVHVECLTVEQ